MTFPLPTKTRLSPSDDADGESREQGFDKAESFGKRRGGGAGGGEEFMIQHFNEMAPILDERQKAVAREFLDNHLSKHRNKDVMPPPPQE